MDSILFYGAIQVNLHIIIKLVNFVLCLFQLINKSFTVEEIPLCKHDATYQSADIHIMRFTKRS